MLGCVCLGGGILALVSKKKPGLHPRAGRVFAIALGLVFLAILPNIIVKKNVFLFGLGWLAVYTCAEGWRALLRFRGRLEPSPTGLDYLLNGLTVVFGLVLAGYGGWLYATRQNPIGLVCVAFGGIGILLVHGTRKLWKAPPDPKGWLVHHITMMTGGAFSAAFTAFAAAQLSGHVGQFEWIVWVAPSVIMSGYVKREIKRRKLTETGDANRSE